MSRHTDRAARVASEEAAEAAQPRGPDAAKVSPGTRAPQPLTGTAVVT